MTNIWKEIKKMSKTKQKQMNGIYTKDKVNVTSDKEIIKEVENYIYMKTSKANKQQKANLKTPLYKQKIIKI